MKKAKYMLIFIMAFIFMGYVRADEAPNGFTLMDDNEKVTAGCSDNTSIQCKYITQDSTNVFCLQKQANIRPATNYSKENTIENSGEACAVLKAMHDGILEVPESDGVKYYYQSLSDANSNSIQREIWNIERDYSENTSCKDIYGNNDGYTFTESNGQYYYSITDQESVIGSISFAVTQRLTKDGDYYVAKMNVEGQNINGGKCTITKSSQDLIVSTSKDGEDITEVDCNGNAVDLYVKIPVTQASEEATYTIKVSGNFNSGTTTLFKPILTRYQATYTPYQSDLSNLQHMGVFGIEKTTVTSPKNIEKEQSLSINSESTVIISKKSATDSKELPGATLQILNSNKEVMACKIINSEGKEEELEDCKWVSGDKPVNVVGLSEGKYFLKEISAPDGYAINESMIEFEVKYGETSQIEMVDELEVDVPNTLSTRSAMIIAIAMFDIALGIGLINYVKKTKTAK